MNRLATLTLASLALSTGIAAAQGGGSVRVTPGYFCHDNKCLRFSNDLSKARVQARRAVSVTEYGLRANPVISDAEFQEIFFRALRAREAAGAGGSR